MVPYPGRGWRGQRRAAPAAPIIAAAEGVTSSAGGAKEGDGQRGPWRVPGGAGVAATSPCPGRFWEPGGDDRTSPMTAQAVPAWVIGPTSLEPLSPGFMGREVIGQEPSTRWVLTRNPCPFCPAASPGATPAAASAASACPVA